MFKKIIAKHDFKSGKAKVIIGTSLRQRGFLENGQIQNPFDEPFRFEQPFGVRTEISTLTVNGDGGAAAITVNDLQTTISNLIVTDSIELPNHEGNVR